MSNLIAWSFFSIIIGSHSWADSDAVCQSAYSNAFQSCVQEAQAQWAFCKSNSMSTNEDGIIGSDTNKSKLDECLRRQSYWPQGSDSNYQSVCENKGQESESRCRQGYGSGQNDGPQYKVKMNGANPIEAPLPPNKPPATTSKDTTAKKDPSSSGKTTESKPVNAQSMSDDQLAARINSDVNQCLSAQSTASQCCNNPSSCVSGYSANSQSYNSSGQGIKELCSQMRETGRSGTGLNTQAAVACASRHTSCQSTCESLASSYEASLNNCGNNCYQVQNAIQTLRGYKQSCAALESRVTMLNSQGSSMAMSGGTSSLCESNGAASPQSLGGGASPSNTGSSAFNSSSDPCTTNPESVACRNQKESQLKSSQGTASFEGETSKKNNGFDLQDPSTTSKAWSGTGIKPESQPVKVQTIANNSGGGIPGNSQSSPAGLNNNRNSRPSPGSPGYSTDILQGTQGGSGYSAPAGYGSESDGSSGYSGSSYGIHGNRASGDNTENMGLDLKQYLPGGRLDPMRKLAGFGRRSEIRAKEEDLWRAISSKIIEKCKLGILIDCQ